MVFIYPPYIYCKYMHFGKHFFYFCSHNLGSRFSVLEMFDYILERLKQINNI